MIQCTVLLWHEIVFDSFDSCCYSTALNAYWTCVAYFKISITSITCDSGEDLWKYSIRFYRRTQRRQHQQGWWWHGVGKGSALSELNNTREYYNSSYELKDTLGRYCSLNSELYDSWYVINNKNRRHHQPVAISWQTGTEYFFNNIMMVHSYVWCFFGVPNSGS